MLRHLLVAHGQSNSRLRNRMYGSVLRTSCGGSCCWRLGLRRIHFPPVITGGNVSGDLASAGGAFGIDPWSSGFGAT